MKWFLWLLFPLTAFGDELTIKGDVQTIRVVNSFPLMIEAPKGGALYQWQVPQGVTATKAANVLTVTAAPKGSLTITAEWIVVDFAKQTIESKAASVAVVVGEVVPPKPPEPEPSPAPIPLDGFRVLFVIESSANIPADQRAVLASAEVRAYLNRKCVDGPKTKQWRQWDQHTVITDEASHWQEAMKRKRDSLPWLIISTGKSGFEGPMPKTISETMTLLKKYGGE